MVQTLIQQFGFMTFFLHVYSLHYYGFPTQITVWGIYKSEYSSASFPLAKAILGFSKKPFLLVPL